MPLRRLMLLSIGLAATAVLYHGLVTWALAWLWTPPPDWWSLPAVPRKLAVLAWLQFLHGVALAVAALPCALLLRLMRVRRPVLAAVAVAGVALVVPALWLSVPALASFSEFMRVSFALDLLKFALVLPALAWLLARSRTNGHAAAPA